MSASSWSSRRRRGQPSRYQLPLFAEATAQLLEAQEDRRAGVVALARFDEYQACDRIQALQREITQSRDSMFLDRPGTAEEYEEQAERNWVLAGEYRRIWRTTNALGLGDRVVELIREREERRPRLAFPQRL